MKKIILFFVVLNMFNAKVFSQSNDIEKRIKELKNQTEKGEIELDSLKLLQKKNDNEQARILSKKIDSLQKERDKLKQASIYEPNSKISFVIGLGYSYSFSRQFQMPIVSDFDNKVKLDVSQRDRISASLGIVYTPFTYLIRDLQHPEGYFIPKGTSFVAFFNPLTLVRNSNLEENFNLGNFGLGGGYKFASGVGIYVVGEFYSLKQPRKWFIDEFINGDKEYKVNGQIQSSFSDTDSKIFTNKLVPAIGIKICYSFDIIKSFASNK